MRELIEKLRIKGTKNESPIIDEPNISTKIVEKLRPVFAKEFQTNDFEFVLPKDFKIFIQQFGNEAVNIGGTYGIYVWSWEGVISNTELWLGDFDINRSKKEAWLCVGEYSDKHWYFMCCDPSSPNFGKVADGHDNTPWNMYDYLDIDDESFTHFLKYVLRHD